MARMQKQPAPEAMQTLSNHAGVAKPCKADAILQHMTRFNRGKQHVGTQLNQISYVVKDHLQ